MKNLLLFSFVLNFAFFLTSCNTAPKDDFIKESINNRYSIMGLAAGAGSWDVSEIKILSISKSKIPKEWEVKAEVSGLYENRSLPEGIQDQHNFTDTVKIVFFKQSRNKWQYRDF